ncbi:MAG: penicillin-binding protein 2 [Actinobacteria bacterium]|nr:MAG: penicillin-binding protein 2 [Actinomycetota bacterium]
MNKQISQVGVAALVLIAALIVGTTYWQTWANAGLADRQDNAIRLVAQFSIKRGKIYASDGTLLAANVTKHVGGQTLYFRRYPTGPIFSDVVGYSTQSRNQTGLERSYNDYLTGSNANLDTVFHATLDRLKGSTVQGNNVYLTLRPGAQALALRELRGKCGAVVAMNPSTGAVYVLASSPPYNPNLIEKHYQQALRSGGKCGALLNRATAGKYQPGSSFKVVTATAALNSGRFTPDSTFYDPGYCEEYGKQVRNAGNPEAPETFGNVTLSTGLVHSINSVFCNIGKAIGAGLIIDYMKRYGFYKLPPLETPENERAASGLYDRHGRLFDPRHPETQVDPGRLAFGQERLQVTPLQMAMVAATVANNGLEVQPYLVQRVVSPHAREINSMMQLVVTGGTGTAAQISGVPVAGKTGTAETGVGDIYTAWFIAFAPADHPKVAVAVVVENQPGGFGGKVSAPIAKDVMEALLR